MTESSNLRFSKYFEPNNAVEYFRYKDVAVWKDEVNESFRISYKELEFPTEEKFGAALDEVHLLFAKLRKLTKDNEVQQMIVEAQEKYRERDSKPTGRKPAKEPDGLSSVTISKDEIRFLHPMLDYVDDCAWVGLHLNAKVARSVNGSTIEINSIEHFLVNSTKQLLHTNTQLPKGMALLTSTIKINQLTWAKDDLQAWLESENRTDPAALYRQLRLKQEYLIEHTQNETYDVVQLWGIGTFFYIIFPAYAELFFGGEKESGKTKCQNFLAQICHIGLQSTSITTAALHRAQDSARCTLFLDEHETIGRRNLPERLQDLKQSLLAGYKKGGKALKVEGDKIKEVREFDVYGPKCLANISGLDDVLENRTIYVIMLRALGPQKNRVVDVFDPEWQDIRNKLYRLFLENAKRVSEISKQENLVPDFIDSRERELWLPLFTLAKFFEENGVENLSANLTEYAKTASKYRHQEESGTNATILIGVLFELVKDPGYYPITTIKERFGKEFDNDSWVTGKFLGNLLRRLGFEEKRRVGRGYEYFIKPEKVKELTQRYGIERQISHTLNTLDSPSSPKSIERSAGSECNVSEIGSGVGVDMALIGRVNIAYDITKQVGKEPVERLVEELTKTRQFVTEDIPTFIELVQNFERKGQDFKCIHCNLSNDLFWAFKHRCRKRDIEQ